jgi:hypothetical protein
MAKKVTRTDRVQIRRMFIVGGGLIAIAGALVLLTSRIVSPRELKLAGIPEFVQSAGLTPGNTTTVLNDTASSAKIFKVYLGEGLDCIAGCKRYEFGLQRGTKIGWLVDSITGRKPAYAFDDTDTVLYSDDFWQRVAAISPDGSGLTYVLIPSIASSPTTPESVLLRIIRENQHGKFLNAIDPLMANPSVPGNKTLLRGMANIPSSDDVLMSAARIWATKQLAK